MAAFASFKERSLSGCPKEPEFAVWNGMIIGECWYLRVSLQVWKGVDVAGARNASQIRPAETLDLLGPGQDEDAS